MGDAQAREGGKKLYHDDFANLLLDLYKKTYLDKLEDTEVAPK